MSHPLDFLYIYMTDQCNLSCIHCWQSAPLAGEGKYARLNFDECKDFLSDAVAMGLNSVVFSGGEPLLNREFPKFAQYFHEQSISMTAETNGILLSNPDIFNTVKKYRIHCAISLDGINPETHNKQRGSATAYQKTVQNIKKLEQEGLSYQLIMALSKFNYQELIPLLDWVKTNCKYCHTFKINVINLLGRAEEMDEQGLLFKPEELPKLAEEIAGLHKTYPFLLLHVDPAFISFKNFKLKYSCGGSCGYQSSLSILANGNISICSLGKQVEDYTFGHISTIDVKEAWNNSPTLTDIHENMQTKLKGICSNCIFKKQCFGGCRAEALCAYGDFFAPHPRCQSYYDSGQFPVARLIDKDMGGNFGIDRKFN